MKKKAHHIFSNQKGGILITSLIILTVLGFFCIFIFKQIIAYSDSVEMYLKKQTNETLYESAKNIGLSFIKNNICAILNNEKFILNKETHFKDNKFKFEIQWLEYPQKLKLSAGFINSSKNISNKNYMLLIHSPFIFNFIAFDYLEINCKLKTGKLFTAYYKKKNKNISEFNNNIRFYTPLANSKISEENFENQNINNSLNNFFVEIPDLEQYIKIADIILEDNYIANQNFSKNIIFKKGDLILRNCSFDSCLIIVTGNLVIEDNFSISGNDKYFFETEEYIKIIDENDFLKLCGLTKSLEEYVNNPNEILKYSMKLSLTNPKKPHSKKIRTSSSPSILCGSELFINLRNPNPDLDSGNIPKLSGLFYASKKISIKNFFCDNNDISFIANEIKISGTDKLIF